MEKRKLWLVLLGFVAGVAGASLGIGGGALLVPCLVLFLSYDIKKAVGISLTAIAPSALVAAVSHYLIKSGNIQFSPALVVSAGAIVGARLGVMVVNRIRGKVMAKILGTLVLFGALKMAGIIKIPEPEGGAVLLWPLLILLGLVGGLSSALLGIGGGVLFVPGLNWFGFPMHQAIGTSLAIIFPTALVGSIFHGKSRRLERSPVICVILGKVLGSVAGALVANVLPDIILKIVFSTFMLFNGVKLLWHRGLKSAE